MEPTPEAPRLAAVVFTDVVGYSAAMQRDEAGTIARVSADLSRMSEVAAQQGGETLNTMGDGMMLAFPSAVQAVTFALKMQEEFALRDGGLQHRIGIHLGDVYRTPAGQIAGDGVNIAARLEGNAPKGGICISQTVYDTVKGKIPVAPVFAGSHSFKNIAEPIPVWHLVPPGVALPLNRPARSAKPLRRMLLAGSAAGVAVAAATAAAWVWRIRSAPAPADPRSIAVLPFANMSDDKEATYFADGIHEDVLTQLALLGQLKVVSRTSVMEYRNTAKKVPQIGEELKVGALVEGSVRRSGDVIRVTAQLVDARADKHLWAGKYDRDLKDVFKVQSELASEIARALNVSLTDAEEKRLARPATTNAEAYDLFLRHEALVRQTAGTVRHISSVRERILLLERAVAADPAFALAWAKLGAEHARTKGYGVDETGEAKARAEDAIRKAVALAPDDLAVQIERAAVFLHALDDQASAGRVYEQVLQRAPHNVEALVGLAEVLNELFRSADAIAALECAIAVDARHSNAISRMAGTFLRFRQFDRTLALRTRLIAQRPDDIDMRANHALLQHWKTGSWEAYDKFRATLPVDAARRSTRVRNTDADRAIARRDWAAVHRLVDLRTDDGVFPSALADSAHRAVEHALVTWASGEQARARAEAKQAMKLVERAIAEARVADAALHEGLTYMQAMLGQREAAFATFDRFVVSERSGNQYIIELTRRQRADVHALLGDADTAVEMLQRQSRHPGFFIHSIRLRLTFVRLWEHPSFAALVADPATNAPLPLDTPLKA